MINTFLKTFLILLMFCPSIYAASSADDCYGNDDVAAVWHFDGADATTVFTSDEVGPKSGTGVADAQIDTAQSKFGSASLLLDGTGDYLTTTDSTDWTLGDDDFTADTWIRFSTIGDPSTQGIWSIYDDQENRFVVGYSVSGATKNIFYVYEEGNVISSINETASWTASVDTWYHFAMTRDSTTFRLFIDGTQVGSDVTDATSVMDFSGGLKVGTMISGAGANNGFFGWIDEFRLVKGTAVWTANFTVETRPYVECENKIQ